MTRLIFLEKAGKDKSGHLLGKYQCTCKNQTIKIIRMSRVDKGLTKSCGCLLDEARKQNNRKHGMYRSAEHNSYKSMIARCYNKKNDNYHLYGGRGVIVCDRWLESFENFFADMGIKPSNKHTLHKDEKTLIYCKENCVWATPKEQANKRRDNVIISYNNIELTLAQWSEKTGINRHSLEGRIERGWSLKDALTIPAKKLENLIEYKGITKSLNEWAKLLDIKRKTLSRRLHSGWSIEKAFTTPVKKRV